MKQSDKTGEQITRELSEVKERLTEGKVLLRQRQDSISDVDLTKTRSINETISDVDEKIERLNSRIEEGSKPETAKRQKDQIDQLNKINDYLKNRKRLLQKGREGRRDLSKLSDEEFQEEVDFARGWINDEYDVEMFNVSDVNRVLDDLKSRISDLNTDREFGDSSKASGIDKQIDRHVRAINFLSDWEKTLRVGEENLSQLGDGTKRWLDYNGRMIDPNSVEEVNSRLQVLKRLREEKEASGSIEGYNKSEVDSSINYLENRLEQLTGNRLAQSDNLNSIMTDIKNQKLQKERAQHKLFLDKTFGEQVKSITNKLYEGAKNAYRGRVRRARKNDSVLKETGIQKNFLRNVDNQVQDVEEANIVSRNIGGSSATDYNKMNNGKPIRKFDIEKGGKKGQIFYVENEDGSVDHMVVNKKPVHPKGGHDDSIPPVRFIEIDGETRLNPFYRFVSPNELSSQTGALQKVKVVDVADPRPDLDGPVVRVADDGEYVANVQKSIGGHSNKKMDDVDELSKEDLIRNNYDAIKFRHNGQDHYKLVAKDQVMEPSQVKNSELLDASKYERMNTNPSYESRGANAESFANKGEELIADLKSMGIDNEEDFDAIRKADIEETTNGNTKKYDPNRPKINPNTTEEGDWVSIKQGDEFVNGKVVGKEGNNFTVRPVNENGQLGKRVVVGVQGDSDLHKPFSMKTSALGIVSVAGAGGVELVPEDMDLQEAGVFGNMIGLLVLGTLAKKGYAVMRRSPMIRQMLQKGYKGADEVAEDVHPAMKSTLDYEQKRAEIEEAQASGIYATHKDRSFNRFKNDMKRILTSDDKESVVESLKHNSWTESTLSMAENSDSRLVKEFVQLMMDSPKEIQKIRNGFETEFNKKHGLNAFKELMREGHNKVDDLVSRTYREGDDLVSRTDKEQAPILKEQFNLGLWRLMNSKIETDANGNRTIVDQTEAVKKSYDGNLEQTFRDIDDRFLQDDEIMDAVESMRNQFNTIQKQWKSVLTGFERDALQSVYLPEKYRTIGKGSDKYVFSEAQYLSLVDDFFLGFDGTFKEYIKAHDDSTIRKVLREGLKRDKGVQKLAEYRNTRMKFTEGLQGMYFPQMISRTKVGRQIDQMGEEKFEKELLESVEELNQNNDKFRKFNPDTDKMESMRFKSEDKAMVYLQNVLMNSPNKAQREFEYNFGPLSPEQEGERFRLINRLKDKNIIKEVNVEIDRGNGKTETAKRFEIHKTDDLVFNVKENGEARQYDIIELANRKDVDDLYEKLLSGEYVKNSNFLERPREFNLHNRYLVTDPEEVLERYSRDVGFRLLMAKNGVLDEDTLQSNWWNQMRSELEAGGSKNPDKVMDRVKTIYQMVGRIEPELVGKKDKQKFLENKMMKQQASEAFRNMLYGMYASKIALYDTIQPLISTSQLTSFGSTFKAYKDVFSNSRQANMRAMSEEHGVIRNQMEAMLADFDDSAKFGMKGSSTQLGEAIGTVNSGMRSWQRLWTDKFDLTHIFPKQFRSTKLLRENAVTRLTLGSMKNKNQTNLPLNWMAHLYEADKASKNLQKLKNGEQLKGLSEEDVYRKFEYMGLTRDEADYFAENVGSVNDALQQLKDEGKSLQSANLEPEIEEHLHTIIQRATEMYHGKNQVFRPDWNSEGARALTTFWNFSFNQSLQITKRRIIQPVQRFNKKYPDTDLSGWTVGKYASLSRVRSPKSMRKKMKEDGLTDDMINDFPFESFDAVVRAGLATGISKVFNWSLNSLLALMTASVFEQIGWDSEDAERKLDDAGYSERTGFDPTEVVMNPNASRDEQMKLGDFGDSTEMRDFTDTLSYFSAMGVMARDEAFNIGLAGPMLGNMVMYGDPTPAGLSMGQRMYEDIHRFASRSPETYTTQENLPRVGYNLARTFVAPLRLLDGVDYEE